MQYTDMSLKRIMINTLSLIYRDKRINDIDFKDMDLFIEYIEEEGQGGEHEINKIKESIKNTVCCKETGRYEIYQGAYIRIFIYGGMDILEAQELADYAQCKLNENFVSYVHMDCKNFNSGGVTMAILIQKKCINQRQIIQRYQDEEGFMSYSYEERFNDNQKG